MEFDKTKSSCPWNSDQNCTQNSARGWWGSGVEGVEGVRGQGWWGQGGGVRGGGGLGGRDSKGWLESRRSRWWSRGRGPGGGGAGVLGPGVIGWGL